MRSNTYTYICIYVYIYKSVRSTHCLLRSIFDRHNLQADSVIRAVVDRFCTAFSLVGNVHQILHTMRFEGVIASVELTQKNTRLSLSAITPNNWNCAHSFYERFSRRILVCGLKKSSLCKNRSSPIIKRNTDGYRSTLSQTNFG